MAWLKIDDNAPHHHKMLMAGDVACWLWLCGLAYCQRHMSDGLIPTGAVRFLGCAGWKASIPRLVEAGLWEDETPLGYRVHDFLKWNDSAETRMRKMEERSARVMKHRETRLKRVTDASPSSDCNTAPTPTPLPTPQPKEQNQELRARFETFWLAYPRKVAKNAAFAEWVRIRPDAQLAADMVAAVERQRQWPQWTKDGGQFIPHPRTWLRQGRWTDVVDAPDLRTEAQRQLDAKHEAAKAQQIEYWRQKQGRTA